VVPVNPSATTIGGLQCFARVQYIQPPLEAALIMVPPAAADGPVRDCAEAGIPRVWLYGTGANMVNAQAVQYCEEHRIRVVAGECPYMFLPKSGFVHRFHGFVRKISGSYPRHASVAS